MSESNLQKAVARIIDASGLLWCHVPNGGQRSITTASRLKAEGTKRGVPDVLIFASPEAEGDDVDKHMADLRGYRPVGLAVELKDGKKNVVSAAQKRWMERLRECGWRAEVCRNVDEVIALLAECYPERFGSNSRAS